MIAHFTKRFNVPSEKVMRERIIPGIHEKVQYSVKESLNKNVAGVYAITTDMWSSKARHGYISYTAHWITADLERKVAILRCMPYSSSHTGESISWVLNNVTDDWGLADIKCVVRDNASNTSYTIHLIVTHVITHSLV